MPSKESHKLFIIIFIITFLIACQAQPKPDLTIKNINMKITSSVFQNNEKLPAKYTCDGEGINPPLQIADVPENAQSLVLISDDPDAPGGTFIHWLVWNIDPQINEIKENSVPGIEGETSYGKTGYGSTCPPSGTHRYYFKAYALDTRLDLNPNSNAGDLEKAMAGHLLDSAELIGLYQR